MFRHIVTVESTENGYILRSDDRSYVVQEREVVEGNFDLQAMRELLYMIMEEFGYFGSKHDPERLVVVIRDQRKVLDEG